MAIDIDWDDHDETLLVVTFDKMWDGNDFIDLVEQLNEIYSMAKHQIHIILDMQRGTETPEHLIYLTQMGLKRNTSNRDKVGTIVIISKTDLWRRIYEIATMLMNTDYDVHFVKDTSHAYELLGSGTSKKDETLPTIRELMNYVLYVEDNELNQDLIRSIITRHYNCHVLFATDEKMTLTLIDDYNPRVVLMDYNLQGSKDGAQITQLLKQNPETQHIPVVALTADIYSRQVFMEAGCDAYLNKPV